MGVDLSQYMGAYVDGSRENLDTMDRMLLAIEQNPSNLEAVEEIFRAAHTLKGMSATMGFEKVAHVTHEMENILDKLRNRQLAVTPQIIDLIFETFDVLRILVNDSISQTNSNVDMNALSAKLAAACAGQLPAGAPAPAGGGHADHTPSPHAEPAPSSPTPAAPAGGGGGGGQYAAELAEFDVSEFEASGFVESQQVGQMPVLLIVRLVADCLLKGPRIFMILRALDSFQCEIKKSIPEVKDLENEKFEHSFKMLITLGRPPADLKGAIESISEVESADVILLTIDDLRPGSGGGAAPQAPQPVAAQVAAPVHAPQAYEAPPQAVHAPAAPAPVAHAPTPSAPAAGPKAEGAPPAGAPPADGEDEKAREIVELVHLVSFTMAGETYALEINQVEGIINLIPITRLPKAPNHIEGIINMRGEIVPVVNLRRKLKLTEKARAPEDQIIILTFEQEKVKVGLLVDSVREVLRIPQTNIDPPTRVSEVNVEYLNGVGKIGNKIIILLNAHRIVFT